MKHLLMAILLAVIATPSVAHSKLESSVPEGEAIVEAVPEEIQLNFARKIRLTRVDVVIEGQLAETLDIGGRKGFLADYALPFPDGGAGNYRIEWRGLGEDGHTMQGAFSFQVQ